MEKQTLAERCYDAANAEDELFNKLRQIMGGKNYSETFKEEEFIWVVKDCCVDSYDRSVEVILDERIPPMTREQADKILDLGFACVYESQGGRGVSWTRSNQYSCSPRYLDDNACKLYSLKTKYKDLAEKYNNLKKESTIDKMNADDIILDLVSRGHNFSETAKFIKEMDEKYKKTNEISSITGEYMIFPTPTKNRPY